MKKIATNRLLCQVLLFLVVFFSFAKGFGQTIPYPAPASDPSFVPPSPNAQAFQVFGSTPVSLYEGLPAVSFPVYEVKCGSLSLPITLSYNYSGLYPLQDASWVGLGWNLSAGGVITRNIEGNVDGLGWTGYNYGEYNIADSMWQATNTFLGAAYNSYSSESYDLAPDVYDCEFNGISSQFIWQNNKAYQLSYNKDMGVSWPSQSGGITVTTADGVSYLFNAIEITNFVGSWQGHKFTRQYPGAWFLSSVISADKKDTIQLSYASFNWQQEQASYIYSYVMSTNGGSDMGASTDFAFSPSIQSMVLQSITCRNVTVNFVQNPTARLDILGTLPSLSEIDVIDKISGNTIKKAVFTCGYFYGPTAGASPTDTRLSLNEFKFVNPQNAGDTQAYKFTYNIGGLNDFPAKGTTNTDYWGLANNAVNNTAGLPPPADGFYNPPPPSYYTFPTGSRTPGANAALGALTKIVYPTGGSTAFTYANNTYYMANGTMPLGPGICVTSILDYATDGDPLPARKRYYSYTYSTGQSSGHLSNLPNFSGPSYSANSNEYNAYVATNSSAGVGGVNPGFYYEMATEISVSGDERHRTDYYFQNYSPSLFLDVRPTTQNEYVFRNGAYTLMKQIVNNYNSTVDTNFTVGVAYLSGYTFTQNANEPVPIYSYRGTSNHIYTTWNALASQDVTQYDSLGTAMTTSSTFNYDAFRNLSSVQQVLADGNSVKQVFKYPENYTNNLTGNMVANRVLKPVLEKQTWYQSGSNPNQTGLVGGMITAYDQTVFKPLAKYGIETSSPIYSLNNQSTSGGLYNTQLSDSHYQLKEQIGYDANNNLTQFNRANDMSTCIIWDYLHSLQIAEVKNATIDQVAYTSFEADGTGSWVIPSASRDASTAITGNKAYNLGWGSISRSGLNSGASYIVSYWSRNGAYSVSGSTGTVTGKTINGWTYYEHSVSGTGSISISGSGDIDELRLYPASAQMTSYTYTPLIGVTSSCDVNNRINYYSYDAWGRLKAQKDQDGNIIKTYDYHYQGQ